MKNYYRYQVALSQLLMVIHIVVRGDIMEFVSWKENQMNPRRKIIHKTQVPGNTTYMRKMSYQNWICWYQAKMVGKKIVSNVQKDDHCTIAMGDFHAWCIFKIICIYHYRWNFWFPCMFLQNNPSILPKNLVICYRIQKNIIGIRK